MECKITQMSKFAAAILKNSQTGTVHSVYRKTINIEFDSGLLALQAEYSPLSPISLITALNETSMESLGLSHGTAVYISESSIIIQSHTFFFDFSEITDLAFSPSLTPPALQKLNTNLESILRTSATGGFDSIFHVYWNIADSLPSLILEGASNYITRAYHFIQREDYPSAASALTRLIGLGTGLTPSGDDFLCGVLAGLLLIGKADSDFALCLKEEVNSCLHNTNDISRAFLICALNNQFSLAVNSLCLPSSETDIKKSFMEIGHSSGFDTLCGVFFIVNILKY